MLDIYFEEKYGKLYEKMENGTCEVFEYHSSFGSIRHMFIKRKIPILLDGKAYFDLITPYGYGGPLILECEQGKEASLVREFENSFSQYCEQNGVVSEFIRFHPIIGNAAFFGHMYDVSFARYTVGTDLFTYRDPIMEEVSKSTRKNIRRALRDGVGYRIIEKPKDLTIFKEIYYSTMDRNDAADFYYFDDDYFRKCLDYFSDNIILTEAVYQDKVIASSFGFFYNKYLHIHLSGTLTEYLYLSPAYILKYASIQWALENNIHIIHYGGGRSNSEDDPLYTFKRGFGKNTTFKFYTGRRIWNTEIYNELCRIKHVPTNTEFFPAYRSH
jgi:predicted N-acyltransferase